VSQGSQGLHAGGSDRHISLTVPALCRTPFAQPAAVVWRVGMRGGAHGLDAFSRPVRGQALKGGASTVLHTPGRHGPSHPPRHRRAPSGGDEAPGERWEPLPDLPYALRRRQWQWPLLTRRRQTRQPAARQPLVETCLRQAPHGLVSNGPKGAVPSPSQSVARSVATDGVSPPIAVRRSERSEGARGTDHSRSQRPERVAHETVAVDTLMGRMGQPTRPQGWKRLRSDGVQATQTLAKVKGASQAALAQVEGGVTGAVQRSARLPYRQR